MHSAYTIRRLNTWDEAKRQQNLQDHSIDFADLDGFFDGDLLTREDVRENYGEVRYQSIGVFNGVALFVAWPPRGEQGDIPQERRKVMKSKRGSSATAGAKGKTDWARVRAMKDADIPFTADAPSTSAEDWADAVAHRGLPLPARKEQPA